MFDPQKHMVLAEKFMDSLKALGHFNFGARETCFRGVTSREVSSATGLSRGIIVNTDKDGLSLVFFFLAGF